MSLWLVVAVFAAGVVTGMLLAFLVAVIYTLEDPRMMARLHQHRTQSEMNTVEDNR